MGVHWTGGKEVHAGLENTVREADIESMFHLSLVKQASVLVVSVIF